MSTLQIIVSALALLLMIYLAVRLGTAAYFKSKQEHESRALTEEVNHGQRP